MYSVAKFPLFYQRNIFYISFYDISEFIKNLHYLKMCVVPMNTAMPTDINH